MVMFGNSPDFEEERPEERIPEIISIEENEITVNLPQPSVHLPPFYEDKWDSYHVK
jgi:hypothetical protein